MSKTATNVSDLLKGDLLSLVKADLEGVSADEKAQITELLAERMRKALEAGVVVDPVSNQMFCCGRYVGSVAKPVGGKRFVLPKAWIKPANQVRPDGEEIAAGFSEISERVLGYSRLAMAPFNGNAVHINTQKGKGLEAVAYAACEIGSNSF